MKKKIKSLLEEMANETPPAIKRYIRLQGDIAVQLANYLKEKGLSQKAFAKSIKMKESQLSRILSGDANLTLKTITKIEAKLGEDLVQVPIFFKPEKNVPIIRYITRTVTLKTTIANDKDWAKINTPPEKTQTLYDNNFTEDLSQVIHGSSYTEEFLPCEMN